MSVWRSSPWIGSSWDGTCPTFTVTFRGRGGLHVRPAGLPLCFCWSSLQKVPVKSPLERPRDAERLHCPAVPKHAWPCVAVSVSATRRYPPPQPLTSQPPVPPMAAQGASANSCEVHRAWVRPAKLRRGSLSAAGLAVREPYSVMLYSSWSTCLPVCCVFGP